MTYMTYTHPYTAPFSVHPYTLATDLHGDPRAEREQTYTVTYTTYTHPYLHVSPPLNRGRTGADMLKACAEFDCGALADGTYCEQHTYKKPPPTVTNYPTADGYDYRWRKLSERARKLQPFCSDCGTRDDLTGDHSPEAWARKADGKTIRLKDIDVVCRTCNIKRGAARGENVTRGEGATRSLRACTAGGEVSLSVPRGVSE